VRESAAHRDTTVRRRPMTRVFTRRGFDVKEKHGGIARQKLCEHAQNSAARAPRTTPRSRVHRSRSRARDELERRAPAGTSLEHRGNIAGTGAPPSAAHPAHDCHLAAQLGKRAILCACDRVDASARSNE
jgi:hypothetical protein